MRREPRRVVPRLVRWCTPVALSVWAVSVPAASASVDDTAGGSAGSTPGTTSLPPGCPLPPTAAAIFVGEVTANDVRTARFRVEQVRAGSLEGFQVGDLVDVDYGDEVRFLDIGTTYLVGVAPDDPGQRLESTVREPAPLFGGNQVAGIDDIDTDCPAIENPVRTLMPDGTPVESGVIAPLLDERGDLLRALVMPAVWVFAALVVLAAVKNLLWASGRELRLLARRRR